MIDSQIIDVTVLSEAFSTFDTKLLMEWGIPGWKTTGVDISHLKRVFHMEKDYDQSSDTQMLRFGVGGEIGAVFMSHIALKPGDKLVVHYTLTAEQGDGPESVTVRGPGGKALRVNIYATVL